MELNATSVIFATLEVMSALHFFGCILQPAPAAGQGVGGVGDSGFQEVSTVHNFVDVILELQSASSCISCGIRGEARVTEANSLYEMDQATQEVINVIVETQSQGLMANRISFGQHLPTISVRRTVGLPELRSLRRTFMKLIGQASLSGPPPPSDADSAKRMFIEYLDRELAA